MGATIEVNDWFTLGLLLGIAADELERIDIDGHNTREKQRKMVSRWLDTGTASWKCLVEALLNPLVDKLEVAKAICEQHSS